MDLHDLCFCRGLLVFKGICVCINCLFARIPPAGKRKAVAGGSRQFRLAPYNNQPPISFIASTLCRLPICRFTKRLLYLPFLAIRMNKLDRPAKIPPPVGEAYSIASTQEFERIYERLYPRLCAFASLILHDRSAVEDVVQEAFLSLWKRRRELIIHTSVDHYLMRSVYNLALQHHTRIHQQQPLSDLFPKGTEGEGWPEGFSDEEVRRLEMVHTAIEQLPEQCRRIFLLNKREGLRQKEIAAMLSLSIKTVDTQITRAVRKIKEYVQLRQLHKKETTANAKDAIFTQK